MKKCCEKLLLWFICSVISLSGFSQNISVKKQIENISVKKDTTFVNNVTIFFKETDQSFIYPVFFDSELETISDIQVSEKKGRKYKPVKNSLITEEHVEYDYIASKKAKYIFIPANTEIKLSYSIACKELMYFSDLRFFSYIEIDTLKYRVNIPNEFKFIYETSYKDSLNFLTIESSKFNDNIVWDIETTPVLVEPDPLISFGIYKNIREPLMRTIIIPESYIGNGKEYMNNWYLEQLKSTRGLNLSTMDKIDELTEGLSEPRLILETLYNYVKYNFKYVAIEIGMGAFIPSDVNEVFEKKQGDCKDLSNFLSEALNYKGVKSYIALASTFNHINDCDFPSLGSANHVICIAILDNKEIILDPTDPIHLPDTPVQSLQNRSIFLINPNGGQFLKAESFSADQNLISYDIDLTENSNHNIEGEFFVNYNGISGNFLRRKFLYKNEEKIQELAKTHFSNILGNQTITDFLLTKNDDYIKSEGKILVKGKIFKDRTNRLLFFDFLPQLFESVERETLLEGSHLGAPFSKKIKLRLKLEEPFKTFDQIDYSLKKEGIELIIKITNPSDSTLEYCYDFKVNYLIIDKENLNTTNDLLKSFKKIINEPIILQNKT